MTKRFQYAVVTCSTVLLAVLLLGTLLGRGAAAGDDAYKHFAVFSEVISKIKSDYVEEPDMKSVTLGAVNGMLESIDPYASYLSAEQYKQYLKAKETPKASVGLLLARRFGYVSVVDSIDGSPAHKLGIDTGDVIEAINNVSTRDMPLAYAELLLEGDPGTTIELSVIRVRRSAEATKIQLVREKIAPPPVTAKMLSDNIGYIQASSLQRGKAAEIAARVSEMERQGAKRLILDLRNNALGTVEEGIIAANLFLDKGVITYVQGQKVPKQNYEADPSKAITRLPLVVMTGRGTAGGAEIIASAVLDNKRGEVVGDRSYGEAAQRKALTLEDGSAVILAVAKYHTPAGKSIPDQGVVPSLLAPDPDPPSEIDDDAPTPQAQPQKKDEDFQLRKAIEVVTLGLQAAKDKDRKQTAQNAPSNPGGSDPKILTPLNVPRPRQK